MTQKSSPPLGGGADRHLAAAGWWRAEPMFHSPSIPPMFAGRLSATRKVYVRRKPMLAGFGSK